MKLFTDIAFVIFCFYIVFIFYQSYQFKKTEKLKSKQNVKPAKYSDDTYWLNQCAKSADNPAWIHHIAKPFIDPIADRPKIEKPYDLEMLIKYRTYQGDQMERRVTVYGLGKFKNRHYVIGYCHLRNARRTFQLPKFKNSIDLKTGELITSPKAYILAYNPDITDLTDEFDALEQGRLESGAF